MTWTVMRRDVDRDVRVAACETEAAAEAARREVQRTHADEDCWIESDEPASVKKPPAVEEPPAEEAPARLPPVIPERRARIPKARVANEPREVSRSELWRVVSRSDLSIPFVMLVAAVVCAVLSTLPHDPRSPFKHEASLEHMPAIAVMWFALVGADVARRIASAWWSSRRLAPMAPVRLRWSVGNLVGTTLLAAFATAQLTAI